MPRPLHVILGDQTAKKLDELTAVLEENKTSLVHRLIREEWQRQRELQPPFTNTTLTPGDVTHTADELVAEVERGLVGRHAVFQPGGMV